jgi:hypothetical protein
MSPANNKLRTQDWKSFCEIVVVNLDEQTIFFLGYVAPIEDGKGPSSNCVAGSRTLA